MRVGRNCNCGSCSIWFAVFVLATTVVAMVVAAVFVVATRVVAIVVAAAFVVATTVVAMVVRRL